MMLPRSLIIIPATTAMYLARDLRAMEVIAVSSAVCSTLVGSAIATRLNVATGPAIIVVAATIFVFALVSRRPWRSGSAAQEVT